MNGKNNVWCHILNLYASLKWKFILSLSNTWFCIAGSTDPRIVSYSKKQTTGVQITESDKDDLLNVYFDQCRPHYKEKFEQQEVSIKIHLVTYPGECKNTFDKIVNNVAMKTRDVGEKLRIVGYTITGIGLIGNLLCISVFCRPSYIATHRVSYYCLARSCSDNLMLIFCIISLYYYALEFSFKAGSDDAFESVNRPRLNQRWIPDILHLGGFEVLKGFFSLN